MNDSATSRMRFQTPARLALEAAFDGGRLTSDGGLLWLAQADRELGLCDKIAGHVPKWRGRSAKHPLVSLVRQRAYPEVLLRLRGPERLRDPRSDLLLKLVSGTLPGTGADLASRATMSRLENAPDGRTCLRMARALGELYVQRRGKGDAPKRVLSGFDSTDDPKSSIERCVSQIT